MHGAHHTCSCDVKEPMLDHFSKPEVQKHKQKGWRKVFKFFMSLLPSHSQADRDRGIGLKPKMPKGADISYLLSLNRDTQKREMLMHLNENK